MKTILTNSRSTSMRRSMFQHHIYVRPDDPLTRKGSKTGWSLRRIPTILRLAESKDEWETLYWLHIFRSYIHQKNAWWKLHYHISTRRQQADRLERNKAIFSREAMCVKGGVSITIRMGFHYTTWHRRHIHSREGSFRLQFRLISTERCLIKCWSSKALRMLT